MNMDPDALAKWIGVAAAAVGLIAAVAKLKPAKVFQALLVVAVLAGGVGLLLLNSGALNGYLDDAISSKAQTAQNVAGRVVAPPGLPVPRPSAETNPPLVVLGVESSSPPDAPSVWPPSPTGPDDAPPDPYGPPFSSLPSPSN